MKTLALALATLTLISYGCNAALARTTKVYAENGRRVAVIKSSPFGDKIYGANGRRVAVTRTR